MIESFVRLDIKAWIYQWINPVERDRQTHRCDTNILNKKNQTEIGHVTMTWWLSWKIKQKCCFVFTTFVYRLSATNSLSLSLSLSLSCLKFLLPIKLVIKTFNFYVIYVANVASKNRVVSFLPVALKSVTFNLTLNYYKCEAAFLAIRYSYGAVIWDERLSNFVFLIMTRKKSHERKRTEGNDAVFFRIKKILEYWDNTHQESTQEYRKS